MAESSEHEGLWFEDSPAGSSRRANRRRVWVVVASVVCIAALAVPVAVALRRVDQRPSLRRLRHRTSREGSPSNK